MIPWSWFSFAIGFSSLLLIEALGILITIVWLTIRAARPPSHPQDT